MRRYLIAGLLIGCVMVVLSGCAAKSPVASNGFSYASAAGGDCGAFMTIANPDGQADTLLAVKSAVSGRAELHTVVKDANGAMVMQRVESIPVPASGTTELKLGSIHVMLFGLNKEMKVGDTFPLTLTFQKGGETAVQVQVKEKN